MKQIYKDLRSTILVALIAFFVCWVSNVWIFPSGRHHVDPDAWLKTQLHLTAEQEKKLAPVEQEYDKRRAELNAKIQALNGELAKALVEEKHYSPRVKAASERVDQLQAELKEVTLQHFYQMQFALTPDQVQKMDELVVHALSHHE
jgi:Spy/CpxP family protein refolding chaperone